LLTKIELQETVLQFSLPVYNQAADLRLRDSD